VTWWPVPYWTDRFNRLAERDEIRFEAVFLAAAGAGYDGLRLRPEEWRFAYRVLDPGAARIGFYRQRRFPGNPLPLVNGDSSLRLVMSYADPTYLLAAALARARGVGYSLFVANTRFDQRPETPGRELLKRWMLRGARSLLVTGPLQREYALAYAPGAQIVEIGNPVDPARTAFPSEDNDRQALRTELRWTDERIALLFVGRLAPEKDLPTLLRAAAHLRGSGLDVAVAIAGTGPQEQELRRLAESLSLPVDFRGFVEGAALGALYRAADIFVLPSASEPWGLVVNEAMDAGLPVLVSDHVGSQPLVEPGVNGDVFRCGDPEALAERLAPFVRDLHLRKSAGTAAREAAGRQTIDAWVERVLAGVGIA
jgi:glycosyltransferase involved in cell wall biosynthesis